MRTSKAASTVVGLAASWVILAGTTSCKRDEPAPTPPPSPKASSLPVDHVAPGELLEGNLVLFGLTMPRGFRIVTKLTTSTAGEMDAPPEDLANYVRARVGDGKVTMGSTSTQFSHVRPRADPKRVLDIRVEKQKAGSRLEVVDVIVVGEVPKSQADALNKAGLTPQGRPDPQLQ